MARRGGSDMPMRPRSIIAAVLIASLPATPSAHAQVASAGVPSQKAALPDTPAGRAAREWLEAFNSADSAALATWANKYSLDRPIGGMLAFRRETGGFDLVS